MNDSLAVREPDLQIIEQAIFETGTGLEALSAGRTALEYYALEEQPS